MSIIPARQQVRQSIEGTATYGARQRSGWVLGPILLAATLLFPPPDGLSLEGWRTAGLALLMVTFWISEALPIPVTALLPLVLIPALGLGNVREAAAPFANPIIFLFLGGFVIALAMQRWNLHRRIAVNLIALMGTRPPRIVAGFLLASALVSMWVSNTATSLMMLPIAISVVELIPAADRAIPANRAFATAVLLSIAYGATTGGMGTLIGTPPLALLAGFVGSNYGFELGFGQWMLLGIPVVLVTLPVVYYVLTRISFKLDHAPMPGMAQLIERERANMGSFSRAEMIVSIVFAVTAAGWIFQPLLARAVPLLTDTTIAMASAILLFALPVDWRRGEFVMNWESTRQLPWDVLLLFGGGLSLSGAISEHGLSNYIGGLSAGLSSVPLWVTISIIGFVILMLTEFTSNTATAATFLPIAAAVAVGMGQNPLLFLIPVALAANCSYMLPVGTPPNAIVFASGRVTLPQMARAGFLLNLALVPIIVGLVFLLGRWVFSIESGIVPSWIK